VYCLTMKQFLR